MGEQIKWVSLPVVLAIHDGLILQFGGLPGVRDLNLLLSALARPEQAAFYQARQAIPALAAIYACGIAKNHAFVDGNKRTAFTVAATFLELNGLYLTLPQPDAVILMLAIATGEIDEAGASKVFRAHCQPLKRSQA
jgi:death on curing protein